MRCPLLLVLALAACSPAWAKKVDLDYQVRLLPNSGQAEVRLTLADGSAVRSLDFALGKANAYSGFQADGQWSQQGERGVWRGVRWRGGRRGGGLSHGLKARSTSLLPW